MFGSDVEAWGIGGRCIAHVSIYCGKLVEDPTYRHAPHRYRRQPHVPSMTFPHVEAMYTGWSNPTRMHSSDFAMGVYRLSSLVVLPEPDESEEEHDHAENYGDDDFGRCASVVGG